MNNYSYEVLEYNKVREKIAEFGVSDKAKEKILSLEPFKKIEEVRKELVIVREYTDFLKYDGGIELEGLKDIENTIRRSELLGNYLDIEELYDLSQNIRLFRIFLKKLKELEKYKHLQSRFLGVPTYKAIEEIIDSVIDKEKKVKDDASLDLRDIRLHKRNIGENIKRKFDDIFSNPSYANAIQDKLITLRDGRSVIPIKADFKGVIKGIEHDRSSSGQTIFIEPLSIVSLNNKKRELDVREREEIRKILLRLTDQVRINKEGLYKIAEELINLDLLNAKSEYGISMKSNVPEVVGKEVVDLVEARHPFIHEREVVPLTFKIGEGYDGLLITGPNTGGKTVALKTAGLLTLMALSGIAIPASEKTRIGFFRGVYADIGDEQSIEQSLSSFSAHLKNVKEILESVDKSSLVLLDELGSGTDPMEGSAFAMAVIDYLLERKCKSIISTHYSEVKAYGYNKEGVETASMEFDLETLSPTYKLLIGIPGESNALIIAKRFGVPNEVIENARSYISDEDKKVEEMITNIRDRSSELDKMKEEVERLKKEASETKMAFEDKLLKLEKEKNKIIEDAYKEAETMLKDTQEKARALVDKIQKDEHKKEDAKKLQKSLNMLRTNVQKEKKKVVEKKPKVKRRIDFVEGEKVFVKSLNQDASIIKINKSKETAIIQAGILKMEVTIDDLQKKIQSKTKSYAKSYGRRGTSVKSEIDIRGRMVEEGIHELEGYMDRALLSGHKEIYVIHGKGTGALRKGILEYLKGSRYVKTFRIGNQNEGGLGCTVVTLK